LTDDGRVFACYKDIHDTIWHAEVGSTKAILDAGYTIDTLMLRYQGVNWTDPANWQCNGGCAHVLTTINNDDDNYTFPVRRLGL
jgi:hypothetical protein